MRRNLDWIQLRLDSDVALLSSQKAAPMEGVTQKAQMDPLWGTYDAVELALLEWMAQDPECSAATAVPLAI